MGRKKGVEEEGSGIENMGRKANCTKRRILSVEGLVSGKRRRGEDDSRYLVSRFYARLGLSDDTERLSRANGG
jgi:hypothetical protein